jgi:hypothetical protein
MSARDGKWTNGKETETGRWVYNWAADNFTISLDSRDPITGRPRTFIVYGDSPEWGKWKLVREEAVTRK